MLSALQSLRNFLVSPNHTRTLSLLIVLVITASVPLAVFIAQQQQDTRQRASVTTESPGGAPYPCNRPPQIQVGQPKAQCAAGNNGLGWVYAQYDHTDDLDGNGNLDDEDDQPYCINSECTEPITYPQSQIPPPPQGCVGDMILRCGSPNRLSASWDVPNENGSCNIYIRDSRGDHVISNTCKGNWESSSLEGGMITHDGRYELYVSNGGSCTNQLKKSVVGSCTSDRGGTQVGVCYLCDSGQWRQAGGGPYIQNGRTSCNNLQGLYATREKLFWCGQQTPNLPQSHCNTPQNGNVLAPVLVGGNLEDQEVVNNYARSDSCDGRNRDSHGILSPSEEVKTRFTNLVRSGRLKYRRFYVTQTVSGPAADFYLRSDGQPWQCGRSAAYGKFVDPTEEATIQILDLIRQGVVKVGETCGDTLPVNSNISCNTNIVCTGMCNAPQNTCSAFNGMQGSCTYTGPAPCDPVPAPDQRCTATTCTGNTTCNNGLCSEQSQTVTTQPSPTTPVATQFTISFTLNNGASQTTSSTVTIAPSCTSTNGVCEIMAISEDNITFSNRSYVPSYDWPLSNTTPGQKTVYIKFRNSQEWSQVISRSITLVAVTPTTTTNPTIPVSPTQRVSPTQGVSPTTPVSTTQPTGTFIPGGTQLAFDLALSGIGGDGENKNPITTSKQLTVQVLNASHNLVVEKTGTITYDASSGHFKGTIDLGPNFASGTYDLRVRTFKYLWKLLPGIHTITSGRTNQIRQGTLVVGDTNADNKIDVTDFGALTNCYGTKAGTSSCANKQIVDFDENDTINGVDLNLFVRALIVKQGD